MPALIAVFLVMLSAYQLFFRYVSLPNARHDGVVYEHDNLTGETREIRPGDHVDPLARVLGDGLAQAIERGHPASMNEAFNFSMLDVSRKHDLTNNDEPGLRGAEPIAGIKPLIPGHAPAYTTGAPVPGNPAPLISTTSTAYTAQGIDLNQDGQPEQVIQRVSANDGLVDISIINNGRELFYGRGRKLNILNSRHDGWLDVSLDGNGGQPVEYVYHRSVDGYVAITQETMTASK